MRRGLGLFVGSIGWLRASVALGEPPLDAAPPVPPPSAAAPEAPPSAASAAPAPPASSAASFGTFGGPSEVTDASPGHTTRNEAPPEPWREKTESPARSPFGEAGEFAVLGGSTFGVSSRSYASSP